MQVLPKYHWPCVPVLDKCRDGNGKETGKWISEISESVSMHIRSISIIGVKTGRKQENGYPRYPNPFLRVSDLFPSLDKWLSVFSSIARYQDQILD